MNERIQKLAEQAREYATTRHPVSNTTLSVNSDLFEQKFAELIVRECAQICQDQPNHYALKTDRDNCAVAIKEHFGVSSA